MFIDELLDRCAKYVAQKKCCKLTYPLFFWKAFREQPSEGWDSGNPAWTEEEYIQFDVFYNFILNRLMLSFLCALYLQDEDKLTKFIELRLRWEENEHKYICGGFFIFEEFVDYCRAVTGASINLTRVYFGPDEGHINTFVVITPPHMLKINTFLHCVLPTYDEYRLSKAVIAKTKIMVGQISSSLPLTALYSEICASYAKYIIENDQRTDVIFDMQEYYRYGREYLYYLTGYVKDLLLWLITNQTVIGALFVKELVDEISPLLADDLDALRGGSMTLVIGELKNSVSLLSIMKNVFNSTKQIKVATEPHPEMMDFSTIGAPIGLTSPRLERGHKIYVKYIVHENVCITPLMKVGKTEKTVSRHDVYKNPHILMYIQNGASSNNVDEELVAFQTAGDIIKSAESLGQLSRLELVYLKSVGQVKKINDAGSEGVVDFIFPQNRLEGDPHIHDDCVVFFVVYYEVLSGDDGRSPWPVYQIGGGATTTIGIIREILNSVGSGSGSEFGIEGTIGVFSCPVKSSYTVSSEMATEVDFKRVCDSVLKIAAKSSSFVNANPSVLFDGTRIQRMHDEQIKIMSRFADGYDAKVVNSYTSLIFRSLARDGLTKPQTLIYQGFPPAVVPLGVVSYFNNAHSPLWMCKQFVETILRCHGMDLGAFEKLFTEAISAKHPTDWPRLYLRSLMGEMLNMMCNMVYHYDVVYGDNDVDSHSNVRSLGGEGDCEDTAEGLYHHVTFLTRTYRKNRKLLESVNSPSLTLLCKIICDYYVPAQTNVFTEKYGSHMVASLIPKAAFLEAIIWKTEYDAGQSVENGACNFSTKKVLPAAAKGDVTIHVPTARLPPIILEGTGVYLNCPIEVDDSHVNERCNEVSKKVKKFRLDSGAAAAAAKQIFWPGDGFKSKPKTDKFYSGMLAVCIDPEDVLADGVFARYLENEKMTNYFRFCNDGRMSDIGEPFMKYMKGDSKFELVGYASDMHILSDHTTEMVDVTRVMKHVALMNAPVPLPLNDTESNHLIIDKCCETKSAFREGVVDTGNIHQAWVKFAESSPHKNMPTDLPLDKKYSVSFTYNPESGCIDINNCIHRQNLWDFLSHFGDDWYVNIVYTWACTFTVMFTIFCT